MKPQAPTERVYDARPIAWIGDHVEVAGWILPAERVQGEAGEVAE